MQLFRTPRLQERLKMFITSVREVVLDWDDEIIIIPGGEKQI